MKTASFLGVIIALIIGGFAGWGIARTSSYGAILPAASPAQGNAVSQAFSSKAAGLRLTANSLFREHAVGGAASLSALYAGVNISQLNQLVQNNGSQISALIARFYGQNTGNQFQQLWSQHMVQYQNYTLARKKNDTAGMATAKQNLSDIANNLGVLLASQSKNLKDTQIRDLMMEHINGTLAIVDAVATGNSGQAVNLTKNAYDQAGKFADVLSQGMMMDNPKAL